MKTNMSCPFKHVWSKEENGAKVTEQSLTSKQDPPQAPTSGCPLGFGGGKQGPNLTNFHCIICKALYYNCKVTNCNHRFCGGCIDKFRDCPVCGADIEHLTSDAEMQDLVDNFIRGHAGSKILYNEDPSNEAESAESSKASIFLQLGLRALAAHNTDAALARFQESKAELLTEGDGVDKVALASVYGCLGDTAREQGDYASALQYYQDSAAAVLLAAPPDIVTDALQQRSSNELQHAQSVAVMKAGETLHLMGDIARAVDKYECGLAIRRDIYEREMTIPAALDVATGHVKCSEAYKNIGQTDKAHKHIKCVERFLHQSVQAPYALNDTQRKKYNLVMQYVSPQPS